MEVGQPVTPDSQFLYTGLKLTPARLISGDLIMTVVGFMQGRSQPHTPGQAR